MARDYASRVGGALSTSRSLNFLLFGSGDPREDLEQGMMGAEGRKMGQEAGVRDQAVMDSGLT